MNKHVSSGETGGKPARPIVLVSDVTWGGAAIACRRLYEGLVGRRGDVRWVGATSHDPMNAVDAGAWPDLTRLVWSRFARRLGVGPRMVARSEGNLAARNVAAIVRAAGPDCIVNLHNIHEAMPFDFVRLLPSGVPLIWTLHDQWPLTGYCCYSYECDKYRDGCRGHCPQMGKWGIAFRSPTIEWRRRQAFYESNRDRMVMVGQSRWMVECARQRFGDLIRVEHIPLSVDANLFRPVPQAAARRVLDLPLDKKIVLTGAVSLNDVRKGTRYLIEAMGFLSGAHRAPPEVVAFGTSGSTCNLPEDWRCVGRIGDERLLNLYYAAADVFVMPSLAESFGQVYLEALAAGTPCVAFNVGGCTDSVRDGETGFVAGEVSGRILADTIGRALDMAAEQSDAMRERCRRVAETDYGPDRQVRAYLSLFGELARAV